MYVHRNIDHGVFLLVEIAKPELDIRWVNYPAPEGTLIVSSARTDVSPKVVENCRPEVGEEGACGFAVPRILPAMLLVARMIARPVRPTGTPHPQLHNRLIMARDVVSVSRLGSRVPHGGVT